MNCTANVDNFPLLGPLSDIENFEKSPLKKRYPWESTYELLIDAGKKYGNNLALAFLKTGERNEEPTKLSFSQFTEQLTQTANLLHSIGVETSDTVSILLPNLIESHLAIWGSQAAGIANPINPLLDADHVIEIMNETRAKVLITLAPDADCSPLSAQLWLKARDIISKVPSLEAVLLITQSDQLPEFEQASPTLIHFNNAIKEQTSSHLLSNRQFSGDDIAAYFHTGGTTGRPKVAKITHGSCAFIAQMCVDLTPTLGQCNTLSPLPLFHIYGVIAAGIGSLTAGRAIIIATADGFRTPNIVINWWHHIARFKVKSFAAVPTILIKLLEIPVGDNDISCLEEIGCGAAALPQNIKIAFEEKFNTHVINGYGMTESTCLISRARKGTLSPTTSVGSRLAYTQIKIAIINGNKSTRECNDGETGVVLIKGPNVFAGYLNKEDDDKAWVDDTWFNTGDMGFIDQEGNLTLTGRSKDLIIRGGHNIDPELIEEQLLQHPAILMAVAIGQPDPHAGELPVAYVTLKPHAEVDESELLQHCQENISERAAIPKRVEIIDEMPLTAVAKIFKPELRNRATEFVVLDTLKAINIEAKVSALVDPQRGQVAQLTIQSTDSLEAAKTALENFPITFEFS